MGYVTKPRNEWFSLLVEAFTVVAAFVILDYAFHYFFTDYAIPDYLFSTYFLPKLAIIPVIYIIHKKKWKTASYAQLSALTSLSMMVRYYWMKTFTYDQQVVFALIHFSIAYVSFKAPKVIFK